MGGECILPRKQQIKLNPCTDGGPGDKGEEQEMKGRWTCGNELT